MESNKEANQLPNVRILIEGMKGHNYALPDCIKFIFERIGDYEQLNFWDIAAVTGDTVAQVYNTNNTTSCEYCVSGYLAGREYVSSVFDAFGYACEYVTAEQLNADKARYMRETVDYIDKALPVLVVTNLNDIPEWKSDVGTHCLVVGYKNSGQTLRLLVGGETIIDYHLSNANKLDLVFIGEKQRDVSLEEVYLNAIKKMPHWLTLPERNGMYFGAAAYRKWAEDIESGRFEDENLLMWENYGVYVCNLATSGGEPTFIFGKLADINPQYAELAEVGKKIQELLPAETPIGGRSLLWIQLEELGGGMDRGGGMDKKTFTVTMQDKEKRSKVAAALRDYARRLDQALALLKDGLEKLENNN